MYVPHPLSTVPQFFPSCAHVRGVQPHTFATPAPPHVWLPLHEPQKVVWPQPVLTVPQFFPSCEHVAGVQPHTFDTPPPPQLCVPEHVPQVM